MPLLPGTGTSDDSGHEKTGIACTAVVAKPAAFRVTPSSRKEDGILEAKALEVNQRKKTIKRLDRPDREHPDHETRPEV